MKGKELMTSFFAANMVDSVLTRTSLEIPGMQELQGWASHYFEAGDINLPILVKTGVIVALIGSYALAQSQGSRLEYPLEKAMKIGTYMVWGIVAWNSVNIAAEVLSKIS